MIARTLKKESGVDVFKNSRNKEIVEVRSLFVYILKKVEGMTFHNIRDFFTNNGKDYDHSTAIHSYKNFEMYSQFNKKLKIYFNSIVPTVESHKAKRFIAKQIIDNAKIEDVEIFTFINNK